MSVNIGLPYISPPLKTERETFLFRDDVSKCGEIFVTDNAEKWTFFCGYCQEITDDIGVFICHIRFDHMGDHSELTQQQIQQNQRNPEENDVPSSPAVVNRIGFMPTIQDAGALPVEEQQPQREIVQEVETMSNTQGDFKTNFFKVSKIVDITSLTQPESDANENLKSCDRKERTFKCNLCYHTFTNKSVYERHVERHKTHRFVCTVCGSLHRNNNELTEHVRTHTGEKPLACPICDRRFARRDLLRLHKSCHETEPKHVCDVCGKKFYRHTGLKNHKYLHLDVKNFVCKICDAAFAQRSVSSILLRLKFKKLKEERPFECNLCHHTFTNQLVYESHIEKHKTHRFVCKVCGSLQRHKNELIAHVRTHTGERPFACPICDRRFAKRSVLLLHKVCHEKEPKYGCDMCDKKFHRRSDLKDHKLLHSDVRTFVCKICGAAFAQRSGLGAHIRRHKNRAFGKPSPGKINTIF